MNKSETARDPKREARVEPAPARPKNTPRLGIKAAAGTGKTHALMVRYLRLIASGSKPAEVLATTFTRKAAGEILGRILERLAEAVLDPKKRAELDQQLQLGRFDESDCRRLFDSLAIHLDSVRIGTLDSLFSNAARHYSLELSLPPGWTILEEMDDQVVRKEAIADVMTELGTATQASIARNLSHGEVKRSIHREIDELVTQLHDHYVGSTEEAWQAIPRSAVLSEAELKQLAIELEETPLPNDKRFHTARAKDLELIRSADWLNFIEKGISRQVACEIDTYCSKPIPSECIEIYKRLNAHARAALMNRMVDKIRAMHQILRAFDEKYRERQVSASGFRFSDVTRSLTSKGLFRDANVLPTALEDHIPSVRHVLIDEFQDTSLVQWEVLEPLIRKCLGPRSGTFFCVGDPKQAIYGWRGGVAELFDALDARVGNLQWSEMTITRRCSPVIVDVVNQVFSSLPANPALEKFADAAQQWTDRFQKHQAHDKDRPGYARLVTSPQKDENEDRDECTLRFAANEIWRIHANAPQATIGVLVGTNEAVGRLLVELRSRGLLASEEGGNPLSRSAAVSLFLSLFTWLDHPGDSASRFHVATSPLGEILALSQDSSELDLADRAHALRRELASRGYVAFVRRLVDALAPRLDSREQDRLDRLVELAILFESRATLRPSEFVRFVESTRVEDSIPAPIRVMTIHQAKGLEFDIVVLPELDQRMRGQSPKVIVHRDETTGPATAILPYANAELQDILGERFRQMFREYWCGIVRESLCKLYVAITRAKYAVHMIVAGSEKLPKNLPESFAGILLGALASGDDPTPETVLFETGDAEWASKVKWKSDSEQQPPHTVSPPVWANATGASRTIRTAPSQLEGIDTDRVGRLLDVHDRKSLDRGTLFHEWFSQIRWIERDAPTRDDLLARAKALPAGTSNADELVDAFLTCIERPNVRSSLSRSILSGEDIAVWTERPILVHVEEMLISGTIDRLVVAKQNGKAVAAVVIDFKTDRLKDAAGLAKRVAIYEPQIRAYCRAVAQMYRLPPDHVTGRLVFAEFGESVDVRHEPGN